MYPSLYEDVFDSPDVSHLPSFVYLVFKGHNYVGFLSAYAHNADTVYIQYSGFAKDVNPVSRLGIFRDVIEIIHERYMFILSLIENSNIKALKMAISTGFKVIGTRQDTNKVLLVEMIKEKDHGIS